MCISHAAQATELADCTNGDISLIDGPNVREGRVQICLNKAWGTVCNTRFSDEDAAIACLSMEFEKIGIVLVYCNYQRKSVN